MYTMLLHYYYYYYYRCCYVCTRYPCTFFLGKNDMPLVFRLVGRGVGKVSGLVQGGQARMGELSKGSELLKVMSPTRAIVA